MKRNNQIIINAAAIFLFAGAAAGQGTSFSQGTISHQRPLITSYNSNGWLNSNPTPRFWYWKNGNDGAYDYSGPAFAETKRWVHVLAPYTKSDPFNNNRLVNNSNNSPNTTQINLLATRIVDQAAVLVENGHVTNTEEFAIFIQNWAFSSNLYRNSQDELATVSNSDGSDYQWSVHSNRPFATSANTATPWRSNGVVDSNAVFQLLVAEIISQINTYNNDPANTHTIPSPSRFILDDENGYFKGSSLDMIAVYQSMMNDPRSDISTGETLHGDYTNWTTSPTPKASEILIDFNPKYTPWYSYSPTPNNSSDQHQYADYITHRSLLLAAADGALESAIEPILNSAWPGCLWTNYSTSGWYSQSYPNFSRGDRGAPYPCSTDTQKFGWDTTARNGSSDMQSPVLYPTHDFQSYEYDQDVCNGSVSPSTRYKTALRHNRMQLDHAIFSFDESGMSTQTPHHIVPWIMRATTLTSVSGSSGHRALTIPKSYTRDVIALTKSKGINEVIFWGDTHGLSSESESQWITTNDAISQIWDYDLRELSTQGGTYTLSKYELDSTRFGEENTYDLAPIPGSNEYTAEFEVEFDVSSSITELGQEFTFITETIDGGGPWKNASYSISIYNYQSGWAGEWEDISTLSATYEDLLSISTRRPTFTHDHSDPTDYEAAWSMEFDDSNIVSDVIDRKSIHKWVFTLPAHPKNRDDYLNVIDHKIKLKVTASYPTQLFAISPDPLRIDLVQFYESDLADDNLSQSGPAFVPGDLNRDGIADLNDRALYINGVSSPSTVQLDWNDDGIFNTADILLMLDLTS